MPDTDNFTIDLKAARRYCQRAKIAIEAGDLVTAEHCAIAAIKVRPSCVLAYQLLAKLQERQGNAQHAATCYRGELPEPLRDQYFPSITPRAAAADSYQRRPVFPAETTPLPVPGTLEPISNPVYSSAEINSSGCYVDVVPGGSLWHDAHNTFVFDQQGNVVVEHSVGEFVVASYLRDCFAPVRIGKRAFLLGARGAHNYYHWLTDIVPRLGVLVAADFEFRETDIFVVPFVRAQFPMDLLAQFNISPHQVYQTEQRHPNISADELVVTHLFNTMGLTMGRWLPAFMRQSMLAQQFGRSDRKLFIERDTATANGRGIGNQAELAEALLCKGFELIKAEQYSVQQQGELFAQASVIVAAHGAGLSNIMYCEPGTVVIEFYGDHIAPCFWAMSAFCEHRYFSMDCTLDLTSGSDGDSESNALRTLAARRSGNFDVPVEKALRLLELARC